MGMWDSIKKTTNKITRSIMPSPSEVGEIIAAEQKAEKAVKKTVGGKGTVKPKTKKAPKAKPATTKKKAPAKAKKPATKKPAKKK
jgi:hypothetical protein|tara:strand:+ start:817 stop:1071 length:255 start_codon:yes stop_codon:yes gene_type:complete